VEYPRVTIVTPTLNQGKFIKTTIDSVLCQDYPNLEYIVMDGGSIDSTLDILKSYGNRLVWMSSPDSGQSEAINKGLARSSGLILTWLNSDDTLLPGAVSMAVEWFRRYPDLDLLYGNAIFVNEDGDYLFNTDVKDCSFGQMVRTCRNPICQPASFFSREAWQKAGGLDTNLHYFLDWDLWLRMMREGVEMLQVNEAFATYRLYPESKTGRGDYPSHELKAIYDKLAPEHRTKEARANMHRRIGEYQDASSQPFQAWLSRRRAWLTER
jgi:glycosyltransferase involved in cell wall biosynthesis